jgi:hypothetical protein
MLRRRYRVAENTDTQIIFGIPDEWKSFEQRNLLFFAALRSGRRSTFVQPCHASQDSVGLIGS